MDTTISFEVNGQPYNQEGEQIVSCNTCGGPTTMIGTGLCDDCWDKLVEVEFGG